jgi:hypothetical protein
VPGTGAAPDHGGDAVELRGVIVAHKSMAVAVHTAEVERQSNIPSLHMSWFGRILFLGKFESLRADVRRWGWMRSVLIRIMSMLRRHVGLHIYRINVRPLVGQSPQPYLPGGIAVRIASPEELLKGADDPELDLRLDFVRAALDRGDMAFGAFEGDRLVGYTWRTFAAAPDRDGLWARVSHPCQYSYKAFTRPSHRGKRIHVAITFVADAYLLGRGYAFEVGYMEITNFSSIGVANFLGRQRIGYAGYVRWFGRLLLFRTHAVKKIRFELFERSRKRSSLVGPDVAIAGPEAGAF